MSVISKYIECWSMFPANRLFLILFRTILLHSVIIISAWICLQDVVEVLLEHGARPPPADDDDKSGRTSRGTGPESGSWGAYFRDMLSKALTQSVRTLDMIANEIDPITDISVPPGVGLEVSGVGLGGMGSTVVYSAAESSTTISGDASSSSVNKTQKSKPRRAATEKVVLTKQPSTAVQSSGASSKKTPRS